MSVSFMILVSIGYIAMLFGATLYNHYKGHQDLFISSAFALFIYAICHLGNTLWLSSLPPAELLKTHYLYFAAIQALLAIGLFIINRKKMRVIMAITIALLVVEVLLGYMVHIDRNVTALNGATTPNMSLSASWFLWDAITFISQLNTFTVFLALTLPKIYQVKTDKPEVGYEKLEDAEAYVAKFDDIKKAKRAPAFFKAASQNLCFYDGVSSQENKDATQVGLLLLNEGIKECCYEPHRTRPVGMFGRFVYWLRT